MRKIPTLFQRDPADLANVTTEPHPDCTWVLAGEGVPTRKFDGTCVLWDGQAWWARREVKSGKRAPEVYIPIETDPATGKTVGWEPAANSAFAKWMSEAIADAPGPEQGTYELCGPKVNGNPEGLEQHMLIRHGIRVLDVPRDFDGLRKYLAECRFQGIVWHHPDGRMAKLKRRDFPENR